MKWRSVVCLAGAVAVSLCAETARAQFEVTREHGRELGADAAYDRERDQYLVVWEHQGVIWGKLISGWGDTVREPFIISALAPTGGVTYTHPAVTFKDPEDVYFVVALTLDPRGPLPWNSVDLFRLGPDGTRLSVRGLATGPAGTLASPDVEADTFGTDCCVLAVWETGGGSLAGQRLTGAGALHEPALRIFDRGARFPSAFHPRVVYQPWPADVFVVAFDRHDTAISSSIVVRSVSAFTEVFGLTDPTVRPSGNAALVWDAGRSNFLAVWEEDAGFPFDEDLWAGFLTRP